MGKLNSVLLSLGLFAVACSPSPIKNSSSDIKIVDESLSQIDLLKNGSHSVSEYDYSSAALNDPDVLSGSSITRTKIDIRGRIYLPSGNGPFPLIVFLHGNHATCGFVTGSGNPRLDTSVDFSSSGRCPSGYVEVPSYRGYDDSARQLASWGYAVASINANRGITGLNGSDSFDSGLIYARGNLVLRHIEELNKWSTQGSSSFLTAEGLDLAGKLDISKVGLMGHSRGGEGVRYAYNTYTSGTTSAKWKARIPGLKFQGIFEIGPVDMGTNNGKNKVEARGVAWNVLIPGCDQDVSDFSGVNPFERMELNADDGYPKSVFTLWGANHNFFNTQWQVSDAPHECIGEQEPLWNVNAPAMPDSFADVDPNARAGLTGSDTQIKFEKALMLAFFHSHLGDGKSLGWDHIFDPQFRMPKQLTSIASASREYLVPSDSKAIFDASVVTTADTVLDSSLSIKTLKTHVADQIKLMAKGLETYANEANDDLYGAVLYSGSFIRAAAVIEGEGSTAGKSAYIPFDAVQSSSGYWTLDMSLATRKGCYTVTSLFNLECPSANIDDKFEVSLVLADGTETPAVAIQDYVKLNNWYDNYFQIVGTQPASGKTNIIFQYVPILYQTARFELSDFGVSSEKIKGVKFNFKSGADVSLILESMRLTKAN